MPSIAATASELANSSRTGLASAASSSRARLPALMRSRARQAGAVLEHELGHRELALREPMRRTVSVARAGVAGGGAPRGGEREEELPRHDVVRQLVDVADDVLQRRRLERRERSGVAPARRRPASGRRSARLPRESTSRTCRARTSGGRAATPTSRARRRPRDSARRTSRPRACLVDEGRAERRPPVAAVDPPTSFGGAPTATARSGGSTVATVARRQRRARNAKLTDLKLTSSASGPTL